MICHITVRPNELKRETRMQFSSQGFSAFTGAYIGAGTYCWNMELDNGIEFQRREQGIISNLHIGKYTSIAEGLSVMLGKTHNIRCVDSGALSLMLQDKGCRPSLTDGQFVQKGSVVIQNDVYVGEKVKIMPNVVVRNGAVIATNSHVVSDVPPYAIVGGNPAKVIGYRFPKEIIEKLQIIRWWDWSEDKLLDNASCFTEDVEAFCDRFFDEANEKFRAYCNGRIPYAEDTYFAFVDFYENYSNYTHILESFLKVFIRDEKKRLILFVQSDLEQKINEDNLNDLYDIVDEIENSSNICCKVSLVCGDNEEAEKNFIQCRHYLISRTYRAVHFSCLADLLGIDILSGVDSRLLFQKVRNIPRAEVSAETGSNSEKPENVKRSIY